jgi:hypothetical protein
MDGRASSGLNANAGSGDVLVAQAQRYRLIAVAGDDRIDAIAVGDGVVSMPAAVTASSPLENSPTDGCAWLSCRLTPVC